MRRAMFVVAVLAATFVAAPDAGSVAGISVSVSSVTTVEGADGENTVVTATVSLSAPAPSAVSVTVTPTAGTARAEADYKQKIAVAKFAQNTTSKTVTFTVYGDSRDEIDEVFSLTATPPGAAYVPGAVGSVTVIDDDGTAYLSVEDDVATESDGRPYTNAHATFTLSQPTEHATVVTFATVPLGFGGCGCFYDPTMAASDRTDYAERFGTVTLNRGKTQVTRAIDVISDNIGEIDEYFEIVIVAVDPAPVPYPEVEVEQGEALVTIIDDDAPLQNSRMAIYEGDLDGVPPARVIEVLQEAEIDRLALSVQQMTFENAHDYAVLVGALSNAGIVVDAYGRDDEWAGDNPTGATQLVNNVIQFNQFSFADFSGIHLNVQPWHNETYTNEDIEQGFYEMFGGGIEPPPSGSDLSQLVHDADMTLELSTDADHEWLISDFDEAGVDTLSIHAHTDHAAGPDGAIAKIADEIATGEALGLGVRVIGDLYEVGGADPYSFWDDGLGWLELQAMLVDGAYNPSSAYRGTGVISFVDLHALMEQQGFLIPLEPVYSSNGFAVFVRQPGYMVNQQILFELASETGLSDIIIDVPDLGTDPEIDDVYRQLITTAHLSNIRVWAAARDTSWLTNPAGVQAWLDEISMFDDTDPIDDFDGVHLALDVFHGGDPLENATIATQFTDLVHNVADNLPLFSNQLDVSIPHFVDGSGSWPDIATAVVGEPNVDVLTIETGVDSSFDAIENIAYEAFQAIGGGKGFRASHQAGYRPDPSTTFHDDGLAYTIYEMNTVDITFGSYAPSWRGNAIDSFNDVIQAITTFPPPPAPPVVTFENLDIVGDPDAPGDPGPQSPLFVYAGPTGPGAPPECPPDGAQFCFVASAPGPGDPMPYIQFDAEAHMIGQPPGSMALQCSLYDGMTLQQGHHSCNNSVFFEVIVLGGPGGGGPETFHGPDLSSSGGAGLPTIEWTEVYYESDSGGGNVYFGPTDNEFAPPECDDGVAEYCFVVSNNASPNTYARWVATWVEHPETPVVCEDSGDGTPVQIPTSPGVVDSGTCTVSDPELPVGENATYFDYILVRQMGPPPGIYVHDIHAVDSFDVSHYDFGWVAMAPSGPMGGFPPEHCPEADVDFCIAAFTAADDVDLRFDVHAPAGSSLNAECSDPISIPIAQGSTGIVVPDLVCTSTGDFTGTLRIRVMYSPSPPAPPAGPGPMITVVNQAITDATIIDYNGPVGGPCPGIVPGSDPEIHLQWCFFTSGAPGTITFDASAYDVEDDAVVPVECTPSSPYFTPPDAFEVGTCEAADSEGNHSYWNYAIVNNGGGSAP